MNKLGNYWYLYLFKAKKECPFFTGNSNWLLLYLQGCAILHFDPIYLKNLLVFKKQEKNIFCYTFAPRSPSQFATKCEKEPKRLSSIPYFLHMCALPVQVLLLHFLCKAGSEGTHEEQPRKKEDADETFRRSAPVPLLSKVTCDIGNKCHSTIPVSDISPLSNSLLCTHLLHLHLWKPWIVRYILYSVYHLQTPLWNARSMVFGEKHSGRSFARLVTSTASSGLTR